MSKTNIDELFNCSEGEMPEQLPLLTAEERNRLYKMSERKYNKDTDEKFVAGDSVSGVERYSRPVWKRRLASVAAAGVLLAGSGGLAYYIKNGNLNGFNDNTAVDMMSPSSEQDYEEIARYLLDGYTDFCSRMEAPESDPSTKVTLHIEGEDVVIARYADKDINSMADFRALGAKYMTEEYLDNNYDFTEAPDKSEWGEGYNIAAYEWYADNANAMFFIYNGGELYTYYHEDNLHWCYKDVEVSDIKDDSFTIRATMEGCINSETVYCPKVFQAERNADNEWRIASTKFDEEKVQAQPFDGVENISETCKRFSDRYIQLQEYIFERPASEDDTLTFTVQIGGTDFEKHYGRIVDDYTKENNVFWNAHSIDEIKQLSGMDEAFFKKMYGENSFYKLDDSYNNGDHISFGDKDPYFIEYKGAIYSQANWKHLIDYDLFAPFTDEPEIVSQSENEIVFRRKTGYRSQTAQLNVMPFTFEFTLWKGLNSGDEWKLSGVTNVYGEDTSSVNTQELEQLFLDYNKLANALCSDKYVDENDTVSYWLNPQKEGVFRKYTNPDYTTPSQLEEEINRLFTSDLIEKIYLLGDDNYKLWTDRDFGDTPEGYTWIDLYAESTLNTPFGYYFIYCNGEVYKNPSANFMIPYYPFDASYEIAVTVIDEKTVNVGIVYDIPESEYVFNGDSVSPACVFRCIKTDEGWKINKFGSVM